MKNTLLIAALGLCTTTAMAQSNQSAEQTSQSLLGSFEVNHWGAFAGTGFHFTTLDGQSTSLHQISIGGVINHNFRLGFSYFHQLEELLLTDEFTPYRQDLQMGSLDLEYVLFPHKTFHLSFPLQLGLGELELDDDLDNGWSGYYDETYFGFVQSGIQLEINLHEYVRLHGGVNYRLALGVDHPLFNTADLSGMSGNVGLRFGLF